MTEATIYSNRGQPTFHFISLANRNMSISQYMLHQSIERQLRSVSWRRYQHSVIIQKPYRFEWLDAYSETRDCFARNQAIFKQARGCGYWLWKPLIIAARVRMATYGDWVVYLDAGIEIRGDITPLFELGDDIVLFNNEWPHVDWCKRDVLQAMLGSWWDTGRQQVQASVICVRVTRETGKFCDEWLSWAERPGFIDDSPSTVPNHPGFREHRHDQAILTNVAIGWGKRFHWWPAHYNTGNRNKYPADRDRYDSMFFHHRTRNDDADPVYPFTDSDRRADNIRQDAFTDYMKSQYIKDHP